jgi:uncharacterized membrane protein YdjX (TVP38/TMEM64 family)
MKLVRVIIIAIILVAAGAFIWLTVGTDAETLILDRLAFTDQHMVLLVLILCAVTLLSTLTGLPVFYLSLSMGFLLNFLPAMMICWGINVVAVMGTFFMVRFTFSDYFREKYGKKKLIKRINSRIGTYGFWSIAFSRAIYIIPTNLINFSFPLSNITSRTYLIGTVLGLLPECLINILTGYLIKHEVILLSSPESRTWQVLVIGGFILLFAIIFVMLRIRRNPEENI